MTSAESRPEPPPRGDERATSTGFLAFLRATIAVKVEGLDRHALHRPHPPSAITLAGMVRHLTFVEDHWSTYVLAGADPVPPWDTAPWSDDPDWDWHTAAEVPPATLLEQWATSVRRTDAQLAGMSLDAESARAVGAQGPVSVRWVITHLIEEYARHAGHADLVREALDGSTGE